MAKVNRASSSVPAARGSSAVPDRRLASLYIKRSTNAPLTAQRVGVLSTYSPTLCGIASFASSLRDALMRDRPGMAVSVARISPEPAPSVAEEVVFEISTADDEFTGKAAAAELNRSDVAVIQHDFSIFGGSAGAQVLQIMNWIRIPTVVVVHAVPALPSDEERKVLMALTESADAVVVLSEVARQRLIATYGVAPRKTMVIQHGGYARVNVNPLQQWPDRRPTILTWGLLRPGKGLETALEAISLLKNLRPLFVIAGPTHPLEHSEAYREGLTETIDRLGIAELVQFIPEYLSPTAIRDLIAGADVVLVPSDSRDLASSGILAEAIAGRVPVVATDFPQAQELMSGEHGGLLVAQDDPSLMAAALSRILTEPELGPQLVDKASGLADAMEWPNVAAHYRQLFDALLRRPSS